MLEGDFSAAFDVFKRFLERVDQRTEVAIELIDADHDYSIEEEMITDSDARAFAQSDEEAREFWRKRIKYSLLVLRGDKDDDERAAAEKQEDEEDEEDEEGD